jgi:protein-S-isoprenylcysteine O-methyltransferase Ste14
VNDKLSVPREARSQHAALHHPRTGHRSGMDSAVVAGNASITDMVALRGVSILLIAVGVAIYLHTGFWGFALHGLGTPAPIAPTKKLVVVGLHRYVRNPMYIGVALVVLGQAMLFWSGHLLRYAVLFLIGEAIRPGIRRLSETGAALDSPLPAVTAIVCAAA